MRRRASSWRARVSPSSTATRPSPSRTRSRRSSTTRRVIVGHERYQQYVMLERLVGAASVGVKVHVKAPPPHSLKKDQVVEGVGGLRILDDVGVKIHKVKGLKPHGKMLLADGVSA